MFDGERVDALLETAQCSAGDGSFARRQIFGVGSELRLYARGATARCNARHDRHRDTIVVGGWASLGGPTPEEFAQPHARDVVHLREPPVADLMRCRIQELHIDSEILVCCNQGGESGIGWRVHQRIRGHALVAPNCADVGGGKHSFAWSRCLFGPTRTRGERDENNREAERERFHLGCSLYVSALNSFTAKAQATSRGPRWAPRNITYNVAACPGLSSFAKKLATVS